MDTYCAERGNEHLNHSQTLTHVEAFYSWKVHTCVQMEVNSAGPTWSYELFDVSAGFLRGPQIIRAEVPLKVLHHDDNREFGIATAHGFWVATDTSKGKQLVDDIAVEIECARTEGVCKEHDAALLMGLLQPESHEYEISNWDQGGILADDMNEDSCGIGHRLSLDFRTNSVIVTDYPKKASGGDCHAFQSANSYSLHGGSIGIAGSNEIFGCTKNGANSVIVAKVEECQGRIMNKAYSRWMDNAEGGPPATSKTPAHSYSQGDCKRLMDQKVAELKSE